MMYDSIENDCNHVCCARYLAMMAKSNNLKKVLWLP